MACTWLAALLLAVAPAGGGGFQNQAPRFVHQQWTVEDGLPVNALTDLVQTSDGWLWIGSFDGLLRFDGLRFTRFDTVVAPALRSNRVIRLLADEDGSLWILSEQGYLTHYAGGRFHAVETAEGDAPSGVGMTLDGDGILWLATLTGLYRVHEGRLVADPEELEGVSVSAVGTGAAGRVWLATGTGRLAAVRRGVLHWAEVGMEAHPMVRFLVEDSDGVLWVGTLEYGLFRWRPEGVERVSDLDDAREAVGAGRLVSSSAYRRAGLSWAAESPGQFFLVQKGPRGAVWFSEGHSLERDGREVLRLPADDVIWAMTFDHEGTLWLTTNLHGLHALRPARVRVLSEAEGLAYRVVHTLHEDRPGVIWIGDASGGLTRVDGDTVTALGEELDHAPQAIFDDPGSGLLLIGGFRTLAEAGSDGRRRAPLEDVWPPRLRDHRLWAVLRTRDGRLLGGYDRGMWESRRGDPREDGWRFHQVEGTAGWCVRALLEDAEGDVWLGTNGHGVARYRRGTLTWVTAAEGLASDLVRDLHLDSDGYLWIATEDRGLSRLDTATLDRPAVIQKRDGLWDDALHRILEDDAGWLWISTNRGVFRVRRAELDDFIAGRRPRVDSVAYTEKDGMRNREANGGAQGAGIRTRGGELWFPTQDGVAIFAPEELVRGLPPPPVHVERLWIGDREVPAAGSDGVTLAAEERSFRIEYTGLSFQAPERMRFAYRLEGYDEAWQDDGNRRSVSYTRVPPGRYTFRVRALSSDGVWSESAASLAIEVRPYFYETDWFRTLCAVAVVALLVAGQRVRERRQRARRRHLENLVTERTAELEREKETVARQAEKLAELDRARSELFANISHELRTPLTLILGPLRDFGEGRFGSLNAEAAREVGRMRANAARLVELVNQILDTAQLEVGGLELSVARDDLGSFVSLVAGRFVAMAERCNLDFRVEVPQAPVWLWFDPEQLDKVLTNLLSNAFKFTPRGGRVRISVGEPKDGRVEVAVRDTGRGIALADLPRLFDRFYQAASANSHRHPGTGLGLALARDLTELHGGTLDVRSRPGKGSTFTVGLRLGRDHFRDEQIVESNADKTTTWSTETATFLLANGIAVVEAVPVEAGDSSVRDDSSARDGVPVDDSDDRTTVLVVDDHPDLRAYLRRHLEERYRVIEAADGAEGLECARRHVPDVIVSDVMMPLSDSAPPRAPEDGFALCRAIKQDPELEFIPVILLTAKVSTEARLRGLGECADDFVAKPFDVRELEARIDNRIALRRRLRERLESAAAERRPAEAATGTGIETRTDATFLDRVYAVIDEHLADEDFQVDALAARLAMSRSLLYLRLEEIGRPPAGLILERRLRRAAELLMDGAASVGEVACAVGFKSVSHFTQRFRERFGKTPSAYRRRVA